MDIKKFKKICGTKNVSESLQLHLKKGALHKTLGIASGKKIPLSREKKAAHSGSKLERERAQFAINARNWHHEEVEPLSEVKKDYENTKAHHTKDGYVGSHFSGHSSGNSKWIEHPDKKFKTEHEARKYAMKFQKESVEPINELSKKTLKSYKEKAGNQSDKLAGASNRNSKEDKKLRNRNRGFTLAHRKMKGSAKVHATEEVEPINELSKNTLKSYVKKGVDSFDTIERNTQRFEKNKRRSQERGGLAKYWDNLADKSDKKYNKRAKYMRKAIRQIAYSEGVKELDELSKKTLGRYIKKASIDNADRAGFQGMDTQTVAGRKGHRDAAHWAAYANDNLVRKYTNRTAGIRKAVDKLTESEINYKEAMSNLKDKKSVFVTEEAENLIQSVIDQKPLDAKTSFDAMIKDKLADMLDVYKAHYTTAKFGGEDDEASQEESKDDDTEKGTDTEDGGDSQNDNDDGQEKELSDEDIENLLGGLSDEELEQLLKDMGAEGDTGGESDPDVTPEPDGTEIAEDKKFFDFKKKDKGKDDKKDDKKKKKFFKKDDDDDDDKKSDDDKCKCDEEVVSENKHKGPLPSADWFMRYESGDMGDDEAINGFQHMVDTGGWKHLQGHYGRTANDLIKAGLVKDTHGHFNVQGLNEKARFSSKWWKPSNKGLALKKGAVDPKKQASKYAEWKRIKDTKGKAAADAMLEGVSEMDDHDDDDDKQTSLARIKKATRPMRTKTEKKELLDPRQGSDWGDAKKQK